MSIFEHSDKIKQKAQSAIAAARKNGFKITAKAQTEKARAASRVLGTR